MTISILGHGEALVTPSLIRRMLFRDRERVAICSVSSQGFAWRWRDSRSEVDATTARALDQALRAARREALALAASSGNVRFLVVDRDSAVTR